MRLQLVSLPAPGCSIRILPALLLVSCAALASARQSPSEPTAGRPHDLGSLIDLALRNSPATGAAWARARAAKARVGEAQAAYYPKVGARFEGGGDRWYTPAAPGPDNFRREQATVSLSLEYVLLDFGRRDSDVRATLAALDAAGFAYEREVQRIVFAVQRAFFAREAAVSRERAARAALEFARLEAGRTGVELETGLTAQPEVFDVKRKVREAEYEVEAAEADARIALGRVCVAAGLPANTPLEIASRGDPPSTGLMRQDVDLLVNRALSLRPDLAGRAAEVRKTEAATRRAAADYFPEVRIEGGWSNSTFQYTARSGRTGGNYRENLNGYGAFLVAEWELFDGFERIKRVAARRREETAAREDLEQARLDATNDVWSAFHQTLRAAGRVEFAEAMEASAKESYDALRAALDSGLSDSVEVAGARSALESARSDLVSATSEYSTCVASLALAVGTFSPQPSSTLPSPP